MISLIRYDEFGKGMGLPSIKETFQKDKYDNQEKIVQYLKGGNVVGVSTSYAVDVMTGKTILEEKKFMNDGVYSWTSTIAYYVEHYNMRLPKDFENHVLNISG